MTNPNTLSTNIVFSNLCKSTSQMHSFFNPNSFSNSFSDAFENKRYLNRYTFDTFYKYYSNSINAINTLKCLSSDKNVAILDRMIEFLRAGIKLARKYEKNFHKKDELIFTFKKKISFHKNIKEFKIVKERIKDALNYAIDLQDELDAFKEIIEDVQSLYDYEPNFVEDNGNPNEHVPSKDVQVRNHTRFYRDGIEAVTDKVLKHQSSFDEFGELILESISKISMSLDILKSEIEFKVGLSYETPSLPKPEIFEKIATKIMPDRTFNVLEMSCSNGYMIKPFVNIEEANTFFIGDVASSLEAKSLGADFVAKEGLRKSTPNGMDIVFCFLNRFPFLQRETDVIFIDNPNPSRYWNGGRFFLSPDKVEDYFRRALSSNLIRTDGFLFINIPRFSIHEFSQMLLNRFTIVNGYSLHDDFDQILFVLKPVISDVSQTHIISKILNKQNPDFEDFEVINLPNGYIEVPLFQPNFFDAEDINDMLTESSTSTLDVLKDSFSYKDDTATLANPLQEPKPGHLAAIASTQIINGIYHNKEIDTAFIFSTKLVRQEGVEITYDEDGTRIETNTKRNSIVAEATLPNGELITLLNTDSIAESSKDDIEDDSDFEE